MPRIASIVFCGIWLFFTLIFAYLTYEADKARNVSLTRFYIEFGKQNATVYVQGLNFQEAMTKMTGVNNKNIEKLEVTLRQSANTSFVLNFASGFLSFLGFLAQCSQYRYSNKQERQSKHNKEPETRKEEINIVSSTNVIENDKAE